MVEGSLPAEYSVDQLGEEPPVRSLQCTMGEFPVDEDVGIGALLLDTEQDIERGMAGIWIRHGDSIVFSTDIIEVRE
jgi:hypothetical protein